MRIRDRQLESCQLPESICGASVSMVLGGCERRRSEREPMGELESALAANQLGSVSLPSFASVSYSTLSRR